MSNEQFILMCLRDGGRSVQNWAHGFISEDANGIGSGLKIDQYDCINIRRVWLSVVDQQNRYSSFNSTFFLLGCMMPGVQKSKILVFVCGCVVNVLNYRKYPNLALLGCSISS